MIKNIFALIFLTISWCSAAGNIPSDSSGVSDYQGNYRVFKSWSDYNFMLEYIDTYHEKRNSESQMILGFKKRVHNNFKLGFYAGRLKGARHDNDWVKKGSSWMWTDTTDKSELLFIAEALGRYDFFLFNKTWVSELRFRALQTSAYNEQSLRVRPGISTVFNRDGRPYIVLTIRNESYIPINFGQSKLYGNWTYIGSLFNFSPTVKLGPFVGFGYEAWTDSKDFKAIKPASDYKATESGTIIGWNLNIYVD